MQLWRQTRQAYVSAKCPPWRCFFATAVTIPAFIFFGMAIRQCALAGLPGWTTGGSLWFLDLCAPDPLLILPAANAAVLLCNMFFAVPDNSSINSLMKDVLLFLPLAALPLTVTARISRAKELILMPVYPCRLICRRLSMCSG